MSRLYAIASSSDHCVLAVPQSEDGLPGGGTSIGAAEYPYVLMLCNSLGTTVDTKQLTFEPLHVAMTANYVFAASKEHFHAWHFRTAKTWTHVDGSYTEQLYNYVD